MMHLRGVVLFLLCLASGARRNMRTNDSHKVARRQNNALATGLEVSVEAQEALIPIGFRQAAAARRHRVLIPLEKKAKLAEQRRQPALASLPSFRGAAPPFRGAGKAPTWLAVARAVLAAALIPRVGRAASYISKKKILQTTKRCSFPLKFDKQKPVLRAYMAMAASDLDALEAAAIKALEREAELDVKFGNGIGAGNERACIAAAIAAFEDAAALASAEAAQETVSEPPSLDAPAVRSHSAEDRVAVFGGNPARRRDELEKRLAPYRSLELYGTPKDVGDSDTRRLVSRIENNQLDVVYAWTRFGSHGSRTIIRKACVKQEPPVRFVEVSSLNYLSDSSYRHECRDADDDCKVS